MPKLIQLGSPYLPGESPYSIFQNRMEAVNTLAEGIGKIMKNKYESGLIQAIVQDIGNPSSPEQISKRSSEIQNGEEAINQQEILDFAIPAIDVMAQSIQGIPEVKEITRRKGAVEQLIGGGTVGEAPEVVTEEAEQPFVLPSGSIESILAYIEGMQGAVDLTKAKEAIMKRPKYLPPSGLETSIANYLLNKPSPQEQFITNVKSAKTLQDILYPEIAEQKELETYGKQLQMQQEKELGTYATKLAMEEALKTPPLTGEQVEERMKALTPPGYEVTNAQVYGDEVHVNLKPAEGEKLSVDETIKQFQQYGVKPHSITLDENGNISSMTLTEPTSVLATGGGGGRAFTSRPKINDILFGETGIIPESFKENIEQNIPLDEEDKQVIIKNYNLRKETLTPEEIAEIERYFKQIGLDLNAPPLPEPDKYAGYRKNWWEFWEGVEGMSEEQLKQAVMTGDVKAIEEARKRGYIK